ncbi:MAG TPA: twin-arginine translocase TatA/TatE family subunit [Ktedonobacterales bacterium]
MLFGHIPELILVLVIGLLVFGPKRMIEMGSSLGKAFRELRESIKDIPGMNGDTSLGDLLGNNEPRRTPFSSISQFAQNLNISKSDDTPAPSASTRAPAATAAPADTGHTIVDGTVQHVEQRPEE